MNFSRVNRTKCYTLDLSWHISGSIAKEAETGTNELTKVHDLTKEGKKWALGTEMLGPISILWSLRKSFNKHNFLSVQSLSCVKLFATPWTTAHQASVHHQLLEFTQTHVHWVSDAPTISSSVIAFSRFQSFPASGSFSMSQLFPSGGQSIGVSASTSVLLMNTQD